MDNKPFSFRNLAAVLLGVLMYLIPFVTVPFLSYRFGNWWLLFGIVFSIAGIIISSLKFKFEIIIAIEVVCLVFWIIEGFNVHDEVTFYFFCLLFGFLCSFLYRFISLNSHTKEMTLPIQKREISTKQETIGN